MSRARTREKSGSKDTPLNSAAPKLDVDSAAPRPPDYADQPRPHWWPWALLAAVVAAFFVYAPALSGPFVFDDLYLPFGRPEADVWARKPTLENRPLLMITFWLNYLVSGQQTFSYHAVNVVLHVVVAILVFTLCRRLLVWAGESLRKADLLSVFGASVFLLHPIHTEAVAYVASRSDVLSTMLAYAALSVFLGGCLRPGGGWGAREQNPQPLGFPRALAILALTGAAVASKEQAAVIPGLLLLADYFWNPGFSFRGIRAHWPIHGAFALAGAAGVAFVLRILAVSDTAGFGSTGVRWFQYFFTQCRVIWHYLLLSVLPLGQNLDPEFSYSRSVWDRGAALGLAALAALSAAAWLYRRSYPLAAFGWLVFLLLIAPTSSVVPIRDVAAERRLYYPFLGLVLILLEAARRIRISRPAGIAAAAAVVCCLGYLTSARAALWADPIALWTETAKASPNKARPRFQLGHALYAAGRFPESAEAYAAAARVEKPDFGLLLDWALALDAAGRGEEAIERLRQAAQIEKGAHVYATIGMVQAKLGRYGDALESLSTARSYDPTHWPTYLYRANTYAALGNWADAAGDYRRVIELNPGNAAATQGLALAQQNLGAR
ncbi:MAG: tetratricopeptide repeat protein [Bryobacteraceae bacterium]